MMAMLDTFEPMAAVMTAVQAVSAAPWKAAVYCDKLVNHYKAMDFEKMVLTPKLKENIGQLREKKFQGW